MTNCGTESTPRRSTDTQGSIYILLILHMYIPYGDSGVTILERTHTHIYIDI